MAFASVLFASFGCSLSELCEVPLDEPIYRRLLRTFLDPKHALSCLEIVKVLYQGSLLVPFRARGIFYSTKIDLFPDQPRAAT